MPLAEMVSWLSTLRENVSAVRVKVPSLLMLAKSNFAFRFVNEEVKLVLPGNRLKLPEKLIEPATTPLVRLKLLTANDGEVNEAKVPIEIVVPVGTKLKFDNENPCCVR